MGRCNDVDDYIGGKLITSRMIGKLMRLCFMYERTYFPYSKWFGTAFKGLNCASPVGELIKTALTAHVYAEREESLCRLLQEVGTLHNKSGLTDPIGTQLIHYHDRPYRGMAPEPFCESLKKVFSEDLKNYDLELLSKTVLYDESNYGSINKENTLIVKAAKKRRR